MEALAVNGEVDAAFWRGKRVLLTGHTGFKGAWAALWLSAMGAHVFGYSRAAAPESLFRIAAVDRDVENTIGDLADERGLRDRIDATCPEIVLHFAAQALVRKAFREPVETFASNVAGTTHLLDALRAQAGLRVVLVVTTDKVYRNRNEGQAFDEDCVLWGEEAYSASKVGQELVAAAYAASYFRPGGITLATARGGNVIGGGDFGEDRLIPDIVRAVRDGRHVAIRHPDATRPWQHVLDCLSGYLVYVEQLWRRDDLPTALNIGPDISDALPVIDVVRLMCGALGRPDAWSIEAAGGPVEARRLALDVSLARTALGWTSRMSAAQAISSTASWHAAHFAGADMRRHCLAEIESFMTGQPTTMAPAGEAV